MFYPRLQKDDSGYTKVEILGSMINIGLGLGFIPGMIFDHFGPRLTSVMSLIVSSGAYSLIWSTGWTVSFYTDKVWSMYVLLAGFGPGFSQMVCLNTNLINFGERHTGKVAGILNAFFAGSPSVFASIYYKFFVHGDDTMAENHDYNGFILMIAIMFSVIPLLCVVRVGLYPEPKESITLIDEDQPEVESQNREHIGNGIASGNQIVLSKVEQEVSVSVFKLLRDFDFILLLLVFTFSSTLSLVFGVNVTVISKSVGLDSYNTTLTLILPISNAIFSVIFGLFSDYFKASIPRLKLITVGSVCFVICYLLTVILPTQIGALMIAASFCGAGVAIAFSMTPAIIKETTNTNNFGRNWGIALFVQAIVSMPSQILFGAMYDWQIHDTVGSDCQGTRCVVGGMGVFLGVSIISLICALF